MITEDVLRQLFPALPQDKRQEYAPLLQSATAEFGITTPLRAAAFLSQIAHESQGLTRLVENLNYSAPRLRAVWPKRFPSDAVANAFARQPEKLANFVYANRNGNGPPESGDGFRYRGRGFIQLTGRANYREFGNLLGTDLEGNPDLAATPDIAFRVAAAFFKSRGCNPLADGQEITRITKLINGGTVGLEERIQLFGKAKRILQAAAPRAGAPVGGARTRGAGPRADEGRDVPRNLSRGIMPGREFVTAEATGKKRPAAKKAGAKKGAGRKGGAKKAAKKAGAKKSAGKRGAKKAGGKKAGAKRGAAKRGASKKGGGKKGAARKGGAKKGGARRGAGSRR